MLAHFKTRFLIMCGLITLSAVLFAPIVAAQCPLIRVPCSDGSITSCAGTPQGTKCEYDRSCLYGGKCKAAFAVVEDGNY